MIFYDESGWDDWDYNYNHPGGTGSKKNSQDAPTGITYFCSVWNSGIWTLICQELNYEAGLFMRKIKDRAWMVGFFRVFWEPCLGRLRRGGDGWRRRKKTLKKEEWLLVPFGICIAKGCENHWWWWWWWWWWGELCLNHCSQEVFLYISRFVYKFWPICSYSWLFLQFYKAHWSLSDLIFPGVNFSQESKQAGTIARRERERRRRRVLVEQQREQEGFRWVDGGWAVMGCDGPQKSEQMDISCVNVLRLQQAPFVS